MTRLAAVRPGWCCLLLFLPLCIGCGRSDKTIVFGKVTLDGNPVPEGVVTFTPMGLKGRSAGSMIENGTYYVPDVYPGPNLIVVEATRQAPGNMGAMMVAAKRLSAQHPELKGKKLERRILKESGMDYMIPPGALGNEQVHDIGYDKEELDLNLETPKD